MVAFKGLVQFTYLSTTSVMMPSTPSCARRAHVGMSSTVQATTENRRACAWLTNSAVMLEAPSLKPRMPSSAYCAHSAGLVSRSGTEPVRNWRALAFMYTTASATWSKDQQDMITREVAL